MDYTFNGVCKGTTKAGNRCKHRVVFANGYCKQHGGDSTEFVREKTRRLVAKLKRRIARLKRKFPDAIR